ncbi:unnamed protein product, partial [Coregonus sp. 'balchen']
TKEKYGKECKICSLPFTVFRWCPGMRRRFKKTEVCQTCSKMKNVCQTWSMVRDTGLDIKDDVPKSDGTLTRHGWWVSFVRSPAPVRCCLSWPYYKRNRLHICSFWVKGEWKRGEECPYRHERPTDPDDLLADQNIKDRYYGINDPVADKLLKRASTMPQLDTPEDKTITTLYESLLPVWGDLDHHHRPEAEAFIQFATRQAAELAAGKSFNKLIINGRRLTVKSQAARRKEAIKDWVSEMGTRLDPLPGLPRALPPPPALEEHTPTNYFNLEPGTSPNVMNISLSPGTSPNIMNVSILPCTSPNVMNISLPLGTSPNVMNISLPPSTSPNVMNISLPPGTSPNVMNISLTPTTSRPPGHIHYPSQDPQRMGAHAASHSN